MDKVLKQNNPFGIRWKYDYYTANIPHDFGSAVERAVTLIPTDPKSRQGRG
jgi:hypothetical protein